MDTNDEREVTLAKPIVWLSPRDANGRRRYDAMPHVVVIVHQRDTHSALIDVDHQRLTPRETKI